MKTQYTKEELRATVALLMDHFDKVDLVCRETGRRIDVEKWEPTDICVIGRLEISSGKSSNIGRVWSVNGRVYQGYCRAIQVEEMPCLLIMQSDVSETVINDPDFYAILEQYNRSMYRDQSTGMFNRRYLEEQYAAHALLRYNKGVEISLAVVKVNEYSSIKEEYGQEAAERLLGTAASVLQRQINLETNDGAVARFEEDSFYISCIGHSKSHFVECLNNIFRQETMTCHIKFGRTEPFTLHIGVVGLAEAESWRDAEEIAFRRMNACTAVCNQVITE